MNNVLLDTGFIFALYDSRDQYHAKAIEYFKHLENNRVIIPQANFYEILNTKFLKRRQPFIDFSNLVSVLEINIINNDGLFYQAYEAVKKYKINLNRNISLVDMTIRLILENPNNKIDALVTFNPKDFTDICTKRIIKLYC